MYLLLNLGKPLAAFLLEIIGSFFSIFMRFANVCTRLPLVVVCGIRGSQLFQDNAEKTRALIERVATWVLQRSIAM